METLIKSTMILGLLIMGSFSIADGLEHRPTKIEFNEQIDKTENSQMELQSELANFYDKDEDLEFLSDDELSSEKQKVVDFIDAELHVGGRKEKKLVDRRFNSVGPAKVAVLPEVKLIKKKPVN